ncbi:MAG TPA: hypothetical protein VM241_03390 [Candidatus Thermoplasmatota archaeon]|nr:hypothetical protein [Candidatus Thermoplasmatota archaeon]
MRLSLVLLVLALAGCVAHAPAPVEQGTLKVAGYASADQAAIAWERIPSAQQPPELPPLFEEAARAGTASLTLEKPRGEAIVDLLAAEWGRQGIPSPPPSHGFPVRYHGQVFLPVFALGPSG